jgi:hypothetical protein
MNTSKIMKLTLITTATVAATIAVPATAHAVPDGSFQSPSGNVYCVMGVNNTGANVAACQVHRYSYAAPPRGDCQLGGWGSQIRLEQGTQPDFECVGGALAAPPIPTLDYGQTRSVGAITCDSEPAGIACTDSSTGHFFRISRESYQLG